MSVCDIGRGRSDSSRRDKPVYLDLRAITRMIAEHLTRYVSGEWLAPSSGDLVISSNPADPSVVVGSAESGSPEQGRSAVESARSALALWQGTAPAARTETLRQIGAAIRSDAEHLARVVAQEVGKPIAEASAEVAQAAQIAEFYAQDIQRSQGEVLSTQSGALSYTARHPLGVVIVITPFNFPVSLPLWKILPAIAYGNTVVWKPSPVTLVISAHITELIGALVPPGVINTVFGGPQLGEALVSDRVDAVTFTGSTSAGLLVARQCAGLNIPVQCELGGKNATIVLEDADLGRAAEGCVRAAFGYAGQKCTATSRLLVQQSIWDRFISALEREMATTTIGDPLEGSTVVGPVISEGQVARLRGVEADARSRLGRPLIRRKAPQGQGWYADLVVVGPVTPDDPIAQQELFGPIVAAIRVRDLQEAVAVNNSVSYGLAAAIYTSSLRSAIEFSEKAKCGLIRVNRTTTGVDYASPLGGEGKSRVGPKELGRAGPDFYTSSRSVWLG